MSEEFERTQARLENIQAIRPILTALRTISLGTWHASLSKIAGTKDYVEDINSIMSLLPPYIPLIPLKALNNQERTSSNTSREILLVVGSDRGLCGKFNTSIVEVLDNYLVGKESGTFQIYSVGNKLRPLINKSGWKIVQHSKLAVKSYPAYQKAFALSKQFFAAFESKQVDRVNVLYNHYLGASKFEPKIFQLIPFSPETKQKIIQHELRSLPIIDTKIEYIYAQSILQLISVTLFQCLLESSASEHSLRYNLMEEAIHNADRIIEELNQSVQMSRKQAITQEMQELASGAGLL